MGVAIYLIAGAIVTASTLIYGWLGITAWSEGRKSLAAAVLACPFLLSLGLPLAVQLLPLSPEDKQRMLTLDLPLATLVLAPGLAGVAFRLYRRAHPAA